MKFLLVSLIALFSFITKYVDQTDSLLANSPEPGFEQRIRIFVDTIRKFDTHEHMFNPEALRNTNFLDFTLLFQQNSYDDLISGGMPDSVYNLIFNRPLGAKEKWKLVEPYWKNSFNTASNRVMLRAMNDLYGISVLNDSTVEILSDKIKKAYSGDWFNHVLKEMCRFDYVVQETDFVGYNSDYFRYSDKFTEWLTIRSRFRIDSLAAVNMEPVKNLGNLVNSLRVEFEKAKNMGMVAVKINLAYFRNLSFGSGDYESARKVLMKLLGGKENYAIPAREAKPLEDFMVHELIKLAQQYNIPVAFHTGQQAGAGNYIANSDPALLTNLFIQYPTVKFVLYHGSYPYGGTLSSIVKSFKNVYLDMNWVYSISPSYAARNLGEWLESVPVSKIMAFGGDQRCVENTYGELQLAKQILSDVLIEKVRSGFFSESEAKTVARMLLYENGVKFYNQ